MRLGKRLQAIIDLIPAGTKVADIGCDHGKVCVYAVASMLATSGVCVDISEKCLEKAKALAKRNGVFEYIEFLCADGLSAVTPESAETVIIAGMGGHNIAAILDASPFVFKKYLLMPHRNPEVAEDALRRKNLQFSYKEIMDGKRKYTIYYTRS